MALALVRKKSCPFRPRFAVVGAGNGGLALAGHLGLAGFPVALFNRTPERIAELKRTGSIEVRGVIEGEARLAEVTSDPERALAGADFVMVVVPASAHATVARLLAPHLRDGQVVVLNPGRTLGAVEFECVLREEGCRAEVVVAEAQTLLYAARCTGPRSVQVFGLKREVLLAALPAGRAPEVVERLRPALPWYVAAPHVLWTSLDNLGAVLHPAPSLLNLGRLEAGPPFEYYREGITPAVARVVEAVDAERCAVAAAWGVSVPTAKEWLQRAYGVEGRDLGEAIRANPAYRGIQAPREVQNRYLYEDVPTGLVPLADLGALAGLEVPVMRSLITLASQVHGMDYWQVGRTLERMGLGDLDRKGFLDYLELGRWVA